jgi:multiple sugar transport system permease protein
MATASLSQNSSEPRLSNRAKKRINAALLTLITALILIVFLLPLAYGVMTSLKTDTQVSTAGAPWYPASPAVYSYEGKEYDIYRVPVEGQARDEEWALVTKGRDASQFIDPNNAQAGLIDWEGRWRTLDQVWHRDPVWRNYIDAWNTIDFPLLLRNTLFYAILSTIGAVGSAALVAYAFARYNLPYKNTLFMIVMATIILPPMVTLIPTYTFFNYIGWVGTWWPLIIPQFFSNERLKAPLQKALS